MRDCMRTILITITFFACAVLPAQSEFVISNAIVEYNSRSGKQIDIQLISSSAENDYIEISVDEVINPGAEDEQRIPLDDPTRGGLIVTPDRMILTAGSRKTLRFVLLDDLSEKEQIYRVTARPVIKGVSTENKMGLKILIGYEILVIVRPQFSEPGFDITRNGRILNISNTGNTNILLQQGKQCPKPDNCISTPSLRVYSGRKETISLPHDAKVTYAIWDGESNKEYSF